MMTVVKYSKFFILTLLISCANHTIKEEGSITTFGFDSSRTGTYKTNFKKEDLKNLHFTKPEWGKNSLKHMPIFLQLKKGDIVKDLLIFGTKNNSIKAFDLRSNKLEWELNLNGEVTATPVFNKKTDIIYFATSSINTPSHLKIKLWAINLKGEIISTIKVDLKQLYERKDIILTENELAGISTKTALSLNNINISPYVFLGFSPNHNPYAKEQKYRLPYAKKRGLTGLLAGFYINSKTGIFSDKEPLTFVPSKVTEDPLTGFNTGIYLAGGNPALLKNNKIILSTGNGPSFGEQDNYGCSIVSINGETFEPQKGESHQTYLSRDPKGFHECFESNVEFASSAPTVFDSGDKSIGFIQDKSGSLFIYEPNNLSGNSPKRTELNSLLDFPGFNGLVYNKGNIYKDKEKINLIFSINAVGRDFYPQAVIPQNNEIESFYEQKNYEKDACYGLLAKRGDIKDSISFFYSGTIKHYSLFSLSINTDLIQSLTIDKLKFYNPKIQPYVTMDRVIPLLSLLDYGYAVPSKGDIPKGFERTALKLYSAITKEHDYFAAFTSVIYKRNDYNPRSPVYNKMGKQLKPLDSKVFNVLRVSRKEKTKTCPTFDSEKYIPLYTYKLKRKEDYQPGFKVYSYDASEIQKPKKNWVYQGEQKEIIEKNAITTIINKDERVTLFNAINIKTSESFVYLLDAINGKKIAKYKIDGKLHFSSLIYTPYGIIAPTTEKGLNFLKL